MSGGLCNGPAEARMAFLLPHLLVLLTWLDFTIKSGVGENFVLGRSMVTHLLGQAISFDRWGD